MATALMLFFTLITSSECKVSINQFKENQSLYFDKITNMMLIRDEWKLVAYYNMEPYWQASRTFDKYIQSLRTTCDFIKQHVHCDAITIQLQQAYSELEYYDHMLLSQHSRTRPGRQRRRRGLIDGIGYIANSLFGVLNERFAEQYQKDIELVRQNEIHIVSLWKNQTSIIEAENNLLKRTETAMNKQFKMVNRHMIDLESALQTLKINIESVSIINDFNTGAIIASNMMQSLKAIQNMLLDTITDIYHGRFNLHLLTPEQLSNELSIIASKLPKDMSLPIDNIHTELRKIYQMLQVKTRMLERTLIFEIRIPLISRDTYEIMKLSEIPKQVGKEMVSIVPVSDYISINMNKDAYMMMSILDVKACLQTRDLYLCHIQKPIFQLKNDRSFCEIEESNCKITTKQCKNLWQETNTINTYVYFCCEPCQVRELCEDQVTAHQLMHSGLISISEGCLIKTNNFTIHSHKLRQSEINVKPELYAPVIAPINYVINLTIPSLNSGNESTDIHQDVLQVADDIKRLKNIEMVSDKISYHDIHHYAMIYVIIAIVGFTAFVLAVRRLRCTHCSWRVPAAPATAAAGMEMTPAPRAAPALPRRCASDQARAPRQHSPSPQHQARDDELFEF